MLFAAAMRIATSVLGTAAGSASNTSRARRLAPSAANTPSAPAGDVRRPAPTRTNVGKNVITTAAAMTVCSP